MFSSHSKDKHPITPVPTGSKSPSTMASPSYEKSQEHITIDIHPTSPEPTLLHPTNEEPVTKQTALQIYHNALGIPPPKAVKKPKATKKDPNPPHPTQPTLTPKNKGIYRLVMAAEKQTRWKYYLCNWVVTFAMFLQIIVGASVTAFGAGSASRTLITVFGAANTALASLLAVLKSQGLPNRIRQDWNGWRELREWIEEKEREIELVVSGRVEGRKVEELDVWGMVRAAEQRYQANRLTSEANRPDTYIKVPVPALPR